MSLAPPLSILPHTPLPEHRRLVDELAEPGVAEGENEGEEAVIAIDVADPQRAWRQEFGEAQAAAAQHQEIMVAEEMKRAILHLDAKRDADAAADLLLQAGRTSEALAGADHLREA